MSQSLMHQERVQLGQKAHCRFGDKGDTGLFMLVPYDAQDFSTMVAEVTPERVAAHLGHVPAERGSVRAVSGAGCDGGGRSPEPGWRRDHVARARRAWQDALRLPAGYDGAMAPNSKVAVALALTS